MMNDLEELKEARRMWLDGDLEKAVGMFEATLAKHPNHFHALLDTARVHGQYFEQGKMEDELDHLMRLYPNQPEVDLQVAMTYRMGYRGKKGAEYSGRATKGKKKFVLALLEKAIVEERLGNLAAASSAAERCVKVAGEFLEGLAVLGKVRMRQGKVRDAKLIFEKVERMSAAGQDPNTRAHVLSDLAKLREKEGEYDRALSTWKNGKKLLEPTGKLLREAVRVKGGEIDGFFAKLTREVVESWNEVGEGFGERLCLMTSFPRSGTTLLERMVGSHDGVLASDEMDVFSKRLLPAFVEKCTSSQVVDPKAFEAVSEHDLAELRNVYFRCQENVMGEELGGRILLDKNPSYTVFIPFFVKLFPRLKLLIPMRDPRDVILSCYTQYFPMNPFSSHFLELESAVKRYLHDMGHWVAMRSVLPEGQFYESSYERLTEDAEGEMKRVMAFLGLEWDIGVLDFMGERAPVIHNAPTYADSGKGIYQGARGRWKHYEGLFEPHREILEPVMEELGYQW